MRLRSTSRVIVALITTVGLIACGGTAEDAQPADRSAEDSAVDEGQEPEPEETRSTSDADDDAGADGAVEAIIGAARTDKIGDGKVWVTSVESAARIRTGERDGDAV